ncbi:hypothetical protein PVK06_024641 [Gossypium arboreum]|uniref:Uncharacterized protein n=1 Tax=Gossypium arboreum TaxID=29729 RepID=A0ABR0PEG1_GOSAR|nr:hypothetical protein PVK06_024641 [Gossypium arboreum]
MELMFNHTIQLCEIQTRIRKKVGGSTQGRISRLQCRYLAFVDHYRYDLFEVNDDLQLKMVILSHVSSENVIIELYVEFAEVDGFSPSLATIAANVGTGVEVESPIIRRTDDLLLSTRTDEGTSNPLLEGDNEGTDEEEYAAEEKDVDKEKDVTDEEDTCEEQGTTNAFDGEESDP